MVGSQTCIAVPTTQGLEIQRTFGGQGDTNTKQPLTQWYVNDMGVGDTGHVNVQPRRDRSACLQMSKSDISSERRDRSACLQLSKSDISSEGSMGSIIESFSSQSQSSESSIREMEERVADMSREDNESKESSEYDEFDDVERINEVDDESDADDDEWEDETEEECEDDVARCCAVSYAVMNSREKHNAVKEMSTLQNAICQNCCCDGQDITNNKHTSRIDVNHSGVLSRGMIKTTKDRGDSRAEDKRRREQAYGDQFATKDEFSVTRSKDRKSLSKKFSLDQIKVPSIEKERVRFACR